MNLADIYKEAYGSEQGIESGETIEKLADALQISPEEAAQALFEEGMIDEDGNWLGEEAVEDVEKVAQDFDAAGRIMARGLMDELENSTIGKEAQDVKTKGIRALLARLRSVPGGAKALGKKGLEKGKEIAKKPGVRYGAGAGLGVAGIGGLGYAAGRRRK